MRFPGNAFPKISGITLSILAAISITVSIVQTCHAITNRVAINSFIPVHPENNELLSGSAGESQKVPGVCIGVVSLILLAGRKYLMPKKAKSKSLVVNIIDLRGRSLLAVQRYSFSLTLSQLGVSRT